MTGETNRQQNDSNQDPFSEVSSTEMNVGPVCRIWNTRYTQHTTSQCSQKPSEMHAQFIRTRKHNYRLAVESGTFKRQYKTTRQQPIYHSPPHEASVQTVQHQRTTRVPPRKHPPTQYVAAIKGAPDQDAEDARRNVSNDGQQGIRPPSKN